MKNLIISFLVIFVCQISSATSFCNEPLNPNSICLEMKNLRSHIMLLDAQRDLLQLNYNYLYTVATSLSFEAKIAKSKLPSELAEHGVALETLAKEADVVAKYSKDMNSDVLRLSSNLRTNCIACHKSKATDPVDSGGPPKFEDIFQMDWNTILAKCNNNGYNPYLCKQMHGLITNYNYILTAWSAGIKNYETTEQVSSEMSRIAEDLLAKKILHERPDLMRNVSEAAQEAANLAKNHDPSAFTKAYSIVESCNLCHRSGPDNFNASTVFNNLKINQLWNSKETLQSIDRGADWLVKNL